MKVNSTNHTDADFNQSVEAAGPQFCGSSYGLVRLMKIDVTLVVQFQSASLLRQSIQLLRRLGDHALVPIAVFVPMFSVVLDDAYSSHSVLKAMR